MRKGERYLREIQVLTARFMADRKFAYPSRIKVFGMEYQLVQPLKLENYQPTDPMREKRSVSK